MTDPTHSVAVIGGAVAGAEVASVLADRGAEVVVFEQNPRPYGKIEDGLPRWHVALRRKEYDGDRRRTCPSRRRAASCRARKDGERHPLPGAGGGLGLLRVWCWPVVPGATARCAIEGADDYIDKGLIYQNPFIIWFNHNVEEGLRRPRALRVRLDDAIVVGGGLASIDVAKVLMLETTKREAPRSAASRKTRSRWR